jgi:foldase protein PrsA
VNPRKPARLAVFAFVIVGLLLVACGTTPPSPAATVGSTPITDAQVEKEARFLTFLAGLSQQKCGKIEGSETQLSACDRFTLSTLIQSSMVGQYASAHKITVLDADLQKALQSLDSQIGADKVNQALTANGLTRTDLNSLLHEFLLYQAVATDMAKAQSTNAQLRPLYQQQILHFTTIDVDHILVKTRALAERVYKQVTARGATEKTFEVVAKKVSIDPSAKTNSGKLGATLASGYVSEFGSAAAALKPGQISKPVHSQYGWHVIRLNSKTVTSFAKAVPQLIQSESSAVFNRWLQSQAKSEKVTVNPKYGRFNIQTLAIDRISSTDSGTPSGSTASSTP